MATNIERRATILRKKIKTLINTYGTTVEISASAYKAADGTTKPARSDSQKAVLQPIAQGFIPQFAELGLANQFDASLHMLLFAYDAELAEGDQMIFGGNIYKATRLFALPFGDYTVAYQVGVTRTDIDDE